MPPNANDLLIELSVKQADTDGLNNLDEDTEDWTDVKHSERKKRDRVLDDGILLKLMKKSDYHGLKRLFTNLSIGAMTISAIYRLEVFPFNDQSFTLEKLLMFLPLYLFYGFQFQCFAFAGQHEFLHRNAFKTKWINDLCLFYTGVFCFEFGKHERVMHKQHHTYTNHIDKDPELTSYYSREILENKAFRNIPLDRVSYVRQFLDIPNTLKCRLGRVFYSAAGIPVDYSGTGWSLGDFYFTKESGIMQDLQRTAVIQILHWVAFLAIFGRTAQGLQGMFFWWIVPVLVGYPAVNYCRNLEHADCEVSRDPNCLLNTRSVRSNLLTRVLLWDTNFHAEHHCYPMVPFYNLHKLSELMHEHVLHNEHDHFTLQNWAALMPGGWIDRQSADMAAYRRQQQEMKKSE
jgi:fatty acid desaturase